MIEGMAPPQPTNTWIRRRWFAASVVIVSVAIPVLDNTILNLAVPTILREFHTQLSSLQWVITGYSLTFATLLIIGGRLGDIFGHRRMFVLGAVDLRGRIVPRVDLHVGADAVRRRGADRGHRRVDDDPGDAVDPLDHVHRARNGPRRSRRGARSRARRWRSARSSAASSPPTTRGAGASGST